jgi:hypothetical protein
MPTFKRISTGETLTYDPDPVRSRPNVEAITTKPKTKAGKNTITGKISGTAKSQRKVAEEKTKPDTLLNILMRDTGHISEVVDSTTGQVISTPESSRGGSMLKGAAQGTAAGFTSTGGTFLDLLRSYDTAGSSYTRRANQEAENAAHYREMLERGTLDDGTPITASMRKQLETLAARAEQRSGVYRQGAEAQHAPIARATQSVYDTADRLAAQSAQNIAEAKEGLGSVGQFAVDVGVAGTQLAGDALLAALTGGSALVPMAVRGFGSGTQQARQEGATLGQQVAYGAGSAALSVATEKIANVAAPLRRTFGSGVLDNAIAKATGRLGQSAAGQTVLSALSEGGEEVVEALVQPVLQRITYDETALQQYQDPDYLADTIYQGLIGGALGGALGAVGSIGRRNTENAQRRSTDAAGTAKTEPAPVSITQAQEAAEGTTGFLEPTLVSRVRQSIPHIQNMNPVAEVTGTEIPRSGKLVDRLSSFVNAIGNKVNRPGFGDVLFSRGRIKSSMIGHGTGPSKIETFAAVPDVIRNGQQIDYQQNWKGRGYDTYTFAAPITYRGQPTYLGVIVTKDSASNRYYLHEVVDANGDVIFRNDESPASTPDGTSTLAGGLDTVVDTGDGAGTTPGTVDTVTDGRASQGVPASDPTIAPGAENVNSDILAQILFGDIRQETGDTQAPPTYDNLGSARRGFTTPGMEGQERTSRLAESMPYNQYQEAATGLSREDYAKLFRYMSQTEGQSLARAEELVYFMRDGQRTFLRDIDETAFHELVQSLDDATAWNAPQMDAARMIQQELQGRSANLEIPSEEYTDFLRIMREHETATGQGVQANAKWSRRNNQNGQSSELEAWDNLQNSNLSEEEKRSTFQRIVKWDTEIEQATEPQQLKDIILNVAQQRGVLNGLTGRQSRIMTAVANSSLDSLTFDQLKQFAYASTSALSTDSTPANMGQKIKTIQILNMLSNPKTAVKNITGNTSFYGLDALSMKGAALLDMALSKVTGTRSVAYERSNLGQAAKAMQMAIAEITMDVDMGGNQSRYGTSSRRTFKASGNFVDRVMSILERNQAYLLNATDEFYKGLARSNASRTQALVDQGKIKTADKDYAQNQADALARYRTFQDDSKLSLAIQQVHDVLNMVAGVGDSGRSIRGRTVHAFGAGDIVAPFTRVAGNLASRGLEYSPANAVKGIVEMSKTVAQAVSGQNVDPAAQARAVSDTTRGLTGTAIAYGFMLLAQSGLLSQAGDEDDPDVAALNSSEGITGTQLNISATERALSGGSTEWQSGDTLIDLSSIEPLNLLMNLGTEMAKSEGNPIVSSFNAVPKSFMDATAELPVMQFIGNAATDIIKYGQDPREVLLQEGANTVASSLIPNILRSTARGLDDRPRNTYSGDTLGEQVADSVKNSIPGLRETLPGSVNPLGEEKLYQGGTADRLLNALLNPLGVNTYNQSEVSQGMEALRERTGDTSFYPSKSAPSEVSYTDEDGNQHSKALTYEERQDYLRDRGAVALTTLSSMMGSSAYKRANDTTKTELLDLCNDYASQRAKKTILGGDSVPAWVNNAETAQNDLGVSPAEYLALYHQYGAGIMSGTAYEKTKQAVAAGLTVQQYVDMKNGLDANGNGSVSQAEARAYLDQQDYSREQKSDLWHIINKSWKKNPYA